MDYMGYDFVINNSMIKNVLITGSNGYLGNKIYLKLKKKIGVKVVTLSRKKSDYICNLTKLNETKKILKSISPDLIIHCAASVPKKINEYNIYGFDEISESYKILYIYQRKP